MEMEVKVGDKVEFKREGIVKIGFVEKLYENSVLVNMEVKKDTEYEFISDKTVVANKNYSIIR